jgi:hypothetical protein
MPVPPLRRAARLLAAGRRGDRCCGARDEYFLSVLSAASEQLVREAFARAEIPFERISIAVEG